MSHTYISQLMHVVFSTKKRCSSILPDMQERLWSYVGGIAQKNGFKTVAVGGTENHVHMLLSLPSTLPLAEAVQLLKGGSYKWLIDATEDRFEGHHGYG